MSALSHLKVRMWEVILGKLRENKYREKQHKVHGSGYNACSIYAHYGSYNMTDHNFQTILIDYLHRSFTLPISPASPCLDHRLLIESVAFYAGCIN